jgi:dipeptidyl-peptidase-4
VLTSGDWDVVRVVDVDETHGDVTFSGTKDGVVEQHLYRVALGGGPVRRLTTEPGWHDAAFHEAGHGVYVESFSDERTPTRHRVRGRNSKLLGELPSTAQVPAPEDIGPAPEILHVQAGPGVDLDIRVVRPHDRPPGTRLPLIIYVYAGPGAQQVRHAWPGERGLYDGWLADRGFVVARIDGRGVAARGHASEHVFAGRLGNLELQDQTAGVRALESRLPEIDPARVGIWGWSYGGYMTLRALTCAPEVFAVGVSVAPVVDWHGYDTHYTERFLGLPSENAAGYDSSSVLPYVARLRGHLTLVHGTTDDNVHFRESMQLVHELVKSGKRFDLMVYPGTHQMESLEERRHLYLLVWRSFAVHL